MTTIKYPRTYHLSWSLGVTNDDKVLKSLENIENEDVVVTLKMDGECTSIYKNYCHARSLTYKASPDRDHIKALQVKLSGQISGQDVRICGENMYAKHSIHYKYLKALFYVFSVWEGSRCLSWDETKEYSNLLGLQVVPVLYRGPFDEKIIKNLYSETYEGDPMEGYVVRVTRSFDITEFGSVVGKTVRGDHVQTTNHWRHTEIIRNELRR